MKILYIANARIPTEKAHGIQLMKMCESFASLGNKVELIVPKRFNKVKGDPFDYYKVKRNFEIKKLFSIDLIFLGRIGFLIQSISFAKLAAFVSLFRKVDLIYSRDEFTLYFLSYFKKNLVFEAHTPRDNFFAKRLIESDVKIVTITEGLKEFYRGKGVAEERLFVASDAVEIEKFTRNLPTKGKCRQTLNLSQNRRLVLYTGHLYGWKGADVLVKAAKHFDLRENVTFVFVGGTDKDIKKFRKRNKDKNVFIAGRVPHERIPMYLRSADVLVLPNSGKSDVSKLYTSPMKLFEYMTSYTPIVASDLPSIREILTDKSALFVEADNDLDLSKGIRKLLADDALGKSLSHEAFRTVTRYTWSNRVKSIFEFLSKKK